MKASSYRQRVDGEEIEVQSHGLHKIACCDCGLVHLLEFRVEGSVITFKATRDNRATAQRRRRLRTVKEVSE
jgi:hypothetical protein